MGKGVGYVTVQALIEVGDVERAVALMGMLFEESSTKPNGAHWFLSSRSRLIIRTAGSLPLYFNAWNNLSWNLSTNGQNSPKEGPKATKKILSDTFRLFSGLNFPMARIFAKFPLY